MRRALPQILVTLVGVLLVLTTFVATPAPVAPHPIASLFAYLDENLSVWFNILAVFAFVLGGASLLSGHLGRIRSRSRDWPYSLVTVASFLIVLALGLGKVGGPPGLQGAVTSPDSWLSWVFANVYSPLKSTVYALLAFFVASAAYRAFRLRTVETSLLLGAAFIVLLGQTPFGARLSDLLPPGLAFLRVDVMAMWLMRVPVTAGWRAILIGIALGIVATSLRLILGLERGPLGGRGE